MNHFVAPSRRTSLWLAASLLASVAAHAVAAAVPNRLSASAQLQNKAPLAQGVSNRIKRAAAVGHLDGDTPIESMSLVLAPSAAQSADLDALLAAQQNPSSPQYHQWLTPEQFGARFGVSSSDRAILKNWLQSRGFTITDEAPSANEIHFSGTASAAEIAFGTTINRYRLGTQTFFENNSAPQLPAAFTGVVSGIRGLSSYRLPASYARPRLLPTIPVAHPDQTSTSGTSTAHFLVPWDVRQIYNANSLVQGGFNGNGITIAVIGQSAVDTTQLSNFQTLTGQTSPKAPTLTIVPGSGNSVALPGDEGESEADLEYASGVAPGASINFVYTGSTSTQGVFGALQYAIANKIGSIITMSYGGCEPDDANFANATLEPALRQAAAQGQTVLISSGDAGATSCDDSLPAELGLQVSYPASSPNVTAVGGTEFIDPTGPTAGTSTYWNTTNNSQQGSAIGYIPEMAWNDTAVQKSPSSGGGGASKIFSKPSWQSGAGVPNDGQRDVPDIAFSASPVTDPYILCTSDTSYSSTSTTTGKTVTGACTATTYGAFAVGGTSLSSPSFAGLLALAIQANGGKSLGNINPILYSLAAGASAGTVFHDVTTGNNQISCTTGTQDCASGTMGYAAGTGYDQATGLGSLNIANFSTALATPAASNTNIATVSIAETSATATNVNLSITVRGANSATVPTGTVNVSYDGGAPTAVMLSNGTAAVQPGAPLTTAGPHTVTAAYAGDGTFAPATSSFKLTTMAANAGFTVTPAATSFTATATAPGKLALNFASVNGFFGIVNITNIALASGTVNPPGCLNVDTGAISLAANGTSTINLTYTEAACTTASNGAVKEPMVASAQPVPPATPQRGLPALAIGLAGALCFAFRKGRNGWAGRLAIFVCLAMSMALAGCGSGGTNGSAVSGGGTGTANATGTFNLILTAQTEGYPYATITQTATFTLIAK